MVATPEPIPTPTESPFTPLTAYFTYHDHQRMLTFHWDGVSPQMELYAGGITRSHMELVPVDTSSVFDEDSAAGWLIWFQFTCQQWIRMREEFEHGKELSSVAPETPAE